MMRGGLTTRLVASFAAIILLCLALAGTTFVYLIQPLQTEQALRRLAELAVPLAVQVRILEAQGASAQEVAAYLADQAEGLGVRILLVRQAGQTVVHDTEGGLVGRTLTFERPLHPGQDPVLVGTVEASGEGRLAVVSFVGPTPRPILERIRRRLPEPQFSVALAVPQAGLAAGWLQVGPQLRSAALISLFASVAAALVIARSITRPLGAITRASEAMARGDYNQRIDVPGGDEVSRLAASFNQMADRVSRSDRTLRDFLADVSHELRTPLTTIQGFSQAILDGTAGDPASIAESARIINEDAARMHHMVEDLLYLSSIESGQLTMERETVNLAELVEGAGRRARQRADGRAVEVDVDGGPQVIFADPRRLEQVLDNLLTNAISHSPPAGRVSVRTFSVDHEARVRVHNTGSFVSIEDRDRIFQRFARGSENGGAGLGLSIASEIVRAHGGRIDLQSSPEDGTTFTVVLPQDGGEEQEPQGGRGETRRPSANAGRS